MVHIIYSVLLVGAGIIGLIFCIFALINPTFAKRHTETSPKIWLWRKYFGVERALYLTRTIFVPLGIIISIGLIISGVGLYLLM